MGRKGRENKMSNKTILIGIAIVATGLVALPQTLALFAGQHNWYTVADVAIDFNGTEANWSTGIPCQKCHADVYAEKIVSGPHKTSVSCESCHIVALARKGTTVGGNKQIHAAGLPSCLDCHDGSWVADAAPDATGIFNDTEAHKTFATQARSSNLLIDANEACVGCHTHVAVDINWQKAYKIAFNAVQTATTGQHSWAVNNFIAEGKVNVSTYGNRAGNNTGITAGPQIDVSGLNIPIYNPANP